MKTCEKCKTVIDGSYGSGRFCSRVCANSRTFNDDSKEKKRQSNIKRYLENGSWGGMLPTLSETERMSVYEKRRQISNKLLLESNFDSLSYEKKRKRILLEQKNSCFECGIDEWRGKKLPLEVDHKNGNHADNSRENLVAICPNCHSITMTWRGRNKSKDSRWLSGEEIYTLYKGGMNIRQILLKMGFAAKGSNYIRVKRIIEKLK